MKDSILLFGARRRVYFLQKLKKSLTDLGLDFDILYSDTDYLDPMCAFADQSLIIPSIHTAEFERVFFENVSEYNIKYIIPWNDDDILHLLPYRKKLEDIGAKICLPSNDIVYLFNDKFKTIKWANEVGLPYPKTSFVINGKCHYSSAFPAIAKPRFGQGSMGIIKFESTNELERWLTFQPTDYLVQEYIKGPEFTTDIFQLKHQQIFVAPRQRIKTRGGECLIAKIDKNEKILKLAKTIISKLDVSGIYNFQTIIKDDIPYILEFNPRFGGGSDLTIEAGGNIPELLLCLYTDNIDKIKPCVIKNNLVMSRYFSPTFY